MAPIRPQPVRIPPVRPPPPRAIRAPAGDPPGCESHQGRGSSFQVSQVFHVVWVSQIHDGGFMPP